MKSLIARLALLSSLCIMGSSCSNDTLSQIGESIQAPQDKVESQMHRLHFEAQSVRAQGVKASGSTASLLGRIADPIYGDFKGEFISQMRTGKGYQFLHEPIGGVIDSVKLILTTPALVGDEHALVKFGVYEVKDPVQKQNQSAESLEHLRRPELQLGSYSGNVHNATGWLKISLQDSVRQVRIPLDKALGERIYKLSKEHPEYFATQQSFQEKVLGGFLVTPQAGSGVVLRVVNTQLHIFYDYKDKEGKKKVGREVFTDTKQTTHQRGLSSTYIDDLLTPNKDYLYIKQPAGVIVALKLDAKEMARLLEGRGQVSVGTNWALADAQFKLTVNNPSDLLLNPPSYMLLLPKDSVETFFAKQQTERSRAATTYLSSQYNVQARYYDFSNISQLITEHLRQHAKYSAGRWQIDAPLELRMMPVERETERINSSSEVTTSINEYLFPCFVRLDKKQGLEVDVISSLLKQ